MSGPNFTNILSQLANILPSGKTATANIRPNATLVNTPQIVVEALAASAKQGFVRGQIVRENRDESYTIRTKDGDIQIQPGIPEKSGTTSATASPAQPAPQFSPGDPIRLDFPVNSLTSDGTLELQVSLLNVSVQDPFLTSRASETPLDIQVKATTQSATIPLSVSARLEHIPAEKINEFSTQSTSNQIINTALQAFDKKLQIIINTQNIDFKHSIHIVEKDIPTPETGAITNQLITEGGVKASPVISQITAPAPNTQNSPLLLQSSTSISPENIGQPNATVIATSNSPAVKPPVTSRIDILPQKIESHSVSLTLPAQETQNVQSNTPQQQVHRAAAHITQNHHAGHSTATIVAFSKEGAPIVTLHSTRGSEHISAHQTTPISAPVNPSTPLAGGEAPEFYILRTPQAFPGVLSVGTQIEIVPQSQTAATTSAHAGTAENIAATNSTAFLLSPGHWPVMTELLQTLNETAPNLAQAMSNITPNAGHSSPAMQMMPAAMLFVAAMRGGDIQSWMGNKAVDLLRSTGKTDLLSRLGGESQSLSRMGAEPLSQDWRAMSLPFLEQGEVQRVALYYKHEDQDGNEGESIKQTRFVFDMSLSQMGKVQVDGLFRAKKLDLIVRTGEHLSPDMRQRMRGAYHDALEVSGLSGELSFQNGEQQYFSIAPQMNEFQGQV